MLGSRGAQWGGVQSESKEPECHRMSETLNHVFGVRTLKRKGGSGFEVDEGL